MTAGHERDDAAIRVVALAGIRSGKSMREIAVDVYSRQFSNLSTREHAWHRCAKRRILPN